MSEFEHNRSGYNNRGCRCAICRAANTAYKRGWRDGLRVGWRTTPYTHKLLLHRVRQQRRNALRLAAAGGFTIAEWLEKCALLGNVCFYCGEAGAMTMEHKVPLSRGGSNDITNIVPACRTCNTAKGTQTASEFLARRAA